MRTTVKRNGRYEVRNVELGTTDFEPKKEIQYKEQDYKRMNDTVKSLVQGDDDFTAIAEDLGLDEGKNLRLPNNIAQEILEVSESFKPYFSSKTAAETYATQYVLTERHSNGNQPVATQVGKFAVYPYVKNLEGLNSNQLNQVFLDITGTEGAGGLLEEIDYINTNFDSQYKHNAYQFFTNVIDLANVNDDERVEALNSLNNIFYANKKAPEIVKEKIESESILENIPENSIQVSGFKNIKTFNFLEDSYYVVFNPLRNNYKAYDINDGSYQGVITDSNALKLIEKNKNKKQEDLLASFNK
jgi:hypothetical protein